MKLGTDFKQPSTVRGLVWGIGGVVAGILIVIGETDKAQAIGALTATVAGGLGVLTKD